MEKQGDMSSSLMRAHMARRAMRQG